MRKFTPKEEAILKGQLQVSPTPAGIWHREAGIPRLGWFCIDIEEDFAQETLCAACETHRIVYVCVMVHPNYPGQLRVGRNCAARMMTGARSRGGPGGGVIPVERLCRL